MKVIKESEEIRTKITDYLNNANDNEMSSITLDSYEDLGDTETGHKYKVMYSVTTHNVVGQNEESGNKIYKDATDYHADEIEIPCEVGECLTEDVDEYEDDIQEINQEFTSANTSINSSKLPAIFKMVSFEPGTINIDYGGGKFDNVADYLTQYDVINLVYDPFNRTAAHNKEVLKTLREAGGADTATCSNVLNVIKEPEVRKNVLQNMARIVKPGGKIYITVYEGTGKGDEKATSAGYQLNRKTADYLDEIREVFPDATRRGKLITATNDSMTESLTEDKVPTDLPKGTLVDFGPYGDLYIVHDVDDETWWVSDEPDDESGWSIKKDLADKVISYPDDYDEDDEEDIDYFSEATQASNVSSGKVDSIDLLEYIDPEQEMRDSDVFLEIDEIADKYGYVLGNAFRDGDQIVIELSNDHQYAPEIWYDYRNEEFRIETSGYGSLNLNEYEQFVRYVQDARDCVRELSDVDLTDIYVLPDGVEVPLDEDWRDGSFTQDDLGKYLDKINDDAYAIKYSLEKMIDKYPEYKTEILSQIASIRNIFSLMHDNLSEDTVKRGNKWVNVGKSGKTHGEFRTKKQADAQRRAMFAQGYKESLDPDTSTNNTDTELSNALISMINAEWDTIADYNKLIDLMTELSHDDMINVINDINSEENKHVGQLQECLKQISDVTNDIAKGEDEGAEQLELLEPDPNADCIEDDCLDYEIVQLDLLDDIL